MRDLAKHRRTPMSPPQLIPPTSPVQVIAGNGRLRRSFSHTGHGPFRALIVSNLKWGALPRPLRVSGRLISNLPQFFRKVHGRHIVFPVHGDIEWPPQTLSSPAAPNHDNLPPGTKDSYTHPTTPSAGLRRRPHLLN